MRACLFLLLPFIFHRKTITTPTYGFTRFQTMKNKHGFEWSRPIIVPDVLLSSDGNMFYRCTETPSGFLCTFSCGVLKALSFTILQAHLSKYQLSVDINPWWSARGLATALGGRGCRDHKKQTLVRGFKGETVRPWVGVESDGGEFHKTVMRWGAEPQIN